MIVNPFSVLELFLCLLRMIFAVAILVTALRLIWRRKHWEEEQVVRRSYLVYYLVALHVGLSVVSWPVLYATLQSYVKQWPQVMCIYGVTKIGAASVSISKFLPYLVNGLQVTKPILVFLSGCCAILYWVNRSTYSSPLFVRVLIVAVIVSAVSVIDGGIETAYLIIPKKEEYAQMACCSAAPSAEFSTARFLPESAGADTDERNVWVIAHFMVCALGIATLAAAVIFINSRSAQRYLLGSLFLVAVGIPVGIRFLLEAGAPAALGLPYHHCAYDLVQVAPEGALGVAIHLFGWFAIGWAAVLHWFGTVRETSGAAGTLIKRVLFMALCAQLGSTTIWLIELTMPG